MKEELKHSIVFCLECGAPFNLRKGKKYCSHGCRSKASAKRAGRFKGVNKSKSSIKLEAKKARVYLNINGLAVDLLYVIGISDLFREGGSYRFYYEVYLLHRESPLVVHIPELQTDVHERIMNNAESVYMHFVNHFLKFKEQQS